MTDKGIVTIQKMAAYLNGLHPEIAEIRYSTKLRAKQTAEIVAQALHKEALLKQTAGLSPDDSAEPLVLELQSLEQPLMVVGHLPYLGILASRLLCKDEEHDPIAFYNAGIVCLIKNGERWQMEWILQPWLVAD